MFSGNISTNKKVISLSLIAIIAFAAWYRQKDKYANVKSLLNEYNDALEAGSKRKAYEAGVKYYANLRGRKINWEDEHRIIRDVARMN